MGLILLNTNILIDHFNGIPEALDEIANHENLAISAITWMEVAAGLSPADAGAFDQLTRQLPVYVLHTTDEIIRETTRLRSASIKAHRAGTGKKLATPDAIILATANITGRQLVTRNPADFAAASTPVRVPYTLTDGIVSNIRPWP
ncbi:PIN domain-containing protein [Massilia oculi]|uniref:Ribonuclease VapC n=1 Tax=Massilia oculi TaxID=945844 RepID=A0A2S2DF50_9BURK|nr:PIN domain-containing protein [Massilia oculi]AWL03719.1 VapC toxin family PIN domain ribonuclease [Massilia oculi]